MTDKELKADLLKTRSVAVTMSKDGIWLRTDSGQREITSDQAEIVWHLGNLGIFSSPPTEEAGGRA